MENTLTCPITEFRNSGFTKVQDFVEQKIGGPVKIVVATHQAGVLTVTYIGL